MNEDPLSDVTTLDPMHDRLIVRPDPTNDKSAGGVILPGQARQRPDTGEIIAVGPGRLDNFGITHPVGLYPGEHILFNQFAGTELKVDGDDYLILSGGDVLAVIRTPEQRANAEQMRGGEVRMPDPRDEG